MSGFVPRIVTIGFDAPERDPNSAVEQWSDEEEEVDAIQTTQELTTLGEDRVENSPPLSTQSKIQDNIEKKVPKKDEKTNVQELIHNGAGFGNNFKDPTSDQKSDGDTQQNRGNYQPKQGESEQNNLRKRSVADFAFGKLLGEGSYAEVRLATEIATDKEYAVKILDKQQIVKEKKAKYVNTEKSIMDMVKHPNIVLLYYTFQDSTRLYFVLELCPNGELLDLIKKAGKLNEECTRFYAAEIVNALECLHSNGIVHRDLKPENVLLGPTMHAKLNDFGTAKIIGNDPSAVSTSFTGTAEYVPPELLKDKHAGKAGDLWALGCIIYQMITGKVPFKGQTEWQTFQLVMENSVLYPEEVTAVAKDLISNLLVLDHSQRLGFGEQGFEKLKAHPFFEGIDWANLHLKTPPVVTTRTEPRLTVGRSMPALGALVSKDAESVSRKSVPPGLEISPNKSLPSTAQANSLWQKFLLPGETILYSGLIRKTKGLSKKKRQLILTDAPRLFYLDPEKGEQKGEIPWSTFLRVIVKDARHWQITVPGRIYYLEDLTNSAPDWAAAINEQMPKYKQKRNTYMQ